MTTANSAYDIIKQGGRLISGPPGGSPPAKYLEEMEEIPFAPSLHQPLPTIPLREATPTLLNVGRAAEEER